MKCLLLGKEAAPLAKEKPVDGSYLIFFLGQVAGLAAVLHGAVDRMGMQGRITRGAGPLVPVVFLGELLRDSSMMPPLRQSTKCRVDSLDIVF